MSKHILIAIVAVFLLASCAAGPEPGLSGQEPRLTPEPGINTELVSLERLFGLIGPDGDHAYVVGQESLALFRDARGYAHEGSVGSVAIEAREGLVPLYRYESKDGRENALAASETRIRELEAEGYLRRESLGFVSLDPGAGLAPLYEFRFGTNHFYTVWREEAVDTYARISRAYFGVACYVFGEAGMEAGKFDGKASAEDPPLRPSTSEKQWTRIESLEGLVVPPEVGRLTQGLICYPESAFTEVRAAFESAWLSLADTCGALPEGNGGLWRWSRDPGFAGLDLHVQSFFTPLGERYIVMPFGESDAYIVRPSTMNTAWGGMAPGPDGAMLEDFAFGAPVSDENLEEGVVYQDFTYARFELGTDGTVIRAIPKRGMIPLPLPRGPRPITAKYLPGRSTLLFLPCCLATSACRAETILSAIPLMNQRRTWFRPSCPRRESTFLMVG
jgi:hypothetical protein